MVHYLHRGKRKLVTMIRNVIKKISIFHVMILCCQPIRYILILIFYYFFIIIFYYYFFFYWCTPSQLRVGGGGNHV